MKRSIKELVALQRKMLAHNKLLLDRLATMCDEIDEQNERIDRALHNPEDCAVSLGGGAMVPPIERDGKLYSRVTGIYICDLEGGES